MQSRLLSALGLLLHTQCAPVPAPTIPPASPPVTRKEIETFERCVADKYFYYKEEAHQNRLFAGVLQVVAIVASVATPILIGWKPKNQAVAGIDWLTATNLALISSAITAGVTAFISFFDHKELWVQFKMARNELGALLHQLRVLAAKEPLAVTEAQFEQLFARYERICTETDAFYRKTRLAPDRPASPDK